MFTATEFSRLLDGLYAAAERGDDLTESIGRTRGILDGTAAHLMWYPPSDGALEITNAKSDPQALAAYQAHFHRVDPWEARLPARSMTLGCVLPSQAVLSHADLKKTEYYADFARPNDMTRILFGITCDQIDG